MLNENAKTWIAALRSGNYKQGKGYLHTAGEVQEFCCLGVACDLAAKAGVIPPAKLVKGSEVGEKDHYQYVGGHSGYMPSQVAEWLGMAEDNDSGNFENHAHTSLVFDNDSGETFESIALAIEVHHDNLFVTPVV